MVGNLVGSNYVFCIGNFVGEALVGGKLTALLHDHERLHVFLDVLAWSAS
jgi:hypothetical protein